jgi:hypothetical protein
MLLAISALALGGCAALDLNVQAYSGAEQPISHVAEVRPLSAQILSVDGAPLKGQCGGRVLRKCNVFLLPGLHSMRVQAMAAYGGGGPDYIAPTVATPGMYLTSSSGYAPVGHPVTVKWVFAAGHDYTLLPCGNCVSSGIGLFDNTTKQGVTAQ